MISDIFNSLEMNNEHFKFYKQDTKFMQSLETKIIFLATKNKKERKKRHIQNKTNMKEYKTQKLKLNPN